MIIVSDTSAITALIQIERATILASLYHEVIVPSEVQTELLKYHEILPSFITVIGVTDQKCFSRLCNEVDPGEAAAITLMLEGRGDLLLIDERRGRAIAKREGLSIVGLLGVLLEAKFKRVIPSLAPVLEELEQIAGFHISSELKSRALTQAGEK